MTTHFCLQFKVVARRTQEGITEEEEQEEEEEEEVMAER